MHPAHSEYDLLVLGSGPGGQKAAVEAAKMKKRVVVVEKKLLGGACIHLGTIPSKTLREAALTTRPDCEDVLFEVMQKKQIVIDHEQTIIQQLFARNFVEFITGTGSFLGPNELEIETESGKFRVKAKYVIIGTGSRPHRPPGVPFDSKTVFDSDTILGMSRKPETLAVVGAGVIGCEYASIFAHMGIKVTLIDQKPSLLGWVDPEVAEALKSQFQEFGMELCLGVSHSDIRVVRNKVEVVVDGKKRTFDALLSCMGRFGNTDGLNLAAAGLKATDRGHLKVNSNYQTQVPHIYAVGDVIGSPGLASASAEQGRLAAAHALSNVEGKFPDSFPYGIYTIPEVSWIGAQEKDLEEKKIPYVVGRAKWKELARGKIIGDDHGFIKLLFDRPEQKLVGVHIIGAGATELVHIGQVAYILGAGVDFFVNNVFNYPTLAEAYKVAAYRAYNKLKYR